MAGLKILLRLRRRWRCIDKIRVQARGRGVFGKASQAVNTGVARRMFRASSATTLKGRFTQMFQPDEQGANITAISHMTQTVTNKQDVSCLEGFIHILFGMN